MTYPNTRKYHWIEADARTFTACGRRYDNGKVHATPDPSLVTCGPCQAAIERELESPEDEAKRRAASRARPIAYQRALAQLRDRHPEEFAELQRAALAQAYPEVYDEELRFLLSLRNGHH